MNFDIATRLPWSKLGLTAVGIAAYAFFWVNGPLQERPAVFEFEEHMAGFGEPGTVGENYQLPKFGVVRPAEQHAFYQIMTATQKEPRLHAVIGDARANPGLKPEVAELILTHARSSAANPEGVTLKTALDMYYAEERDKSGKPVALYMENTGLNKDVKGYAGPIDIGVTVGMDGKIRSVKHLKSMETTSYLKKIENNGFYERFQSIPLEGKTYTVDLVSGASLTTEGIAKSVSQLVSIARESPLETYIDTRAAGFDVKAVLPSTWMIDAALITALFAVVWLKVLRRSTVLSIAFGIVTVLYLGFYLNDSFTYVTYTQPFTGVGWSYVLGIYATLVLASAIWDGNSYCRYVCPYGNVQRLLLRVIPLRGRLAVSNRLLTAVRWAIAVALIVGIAMGLRDWGSFELFPDLFGLEILNSPWFWLALASVLVSAYYPMLWCRMLCPTGAILDGVADLARARQRRGTEPSLAGIPVKTELAAAQ